MKTDMVITTSIILVNFNNAIETIDCVNSIISYIKEPIHIIVVDNNSTDNSYDEINSWAAQKFDNTIIERGKDEREQYDFFFTKITFLNSNIYSLSLIKSSYNGGFAFGNNLGIFFSLSHFNSMFFWLLNNDTKVQTKSLSELITILQSKKNIGLAGSLLLHYDRETIIQSAGGIYNKITGTNKNSLANVQLKDAEQKALLVNTSRVNYPIAASVLVKKEFLMDVGLMNENYFLYFEEIDWVTRGRKKGWKFEMAYNSKVLHKEGNTINYGYADRSKISDYFSFRGRLVYTRLYNPLFLPIVYIISSFFYIYNRLKRRQFDRIWFPFLILLKPNMPINYIKSIATPAKTSNS